MVEQETMTLRVTIGIDPGATGAIAILADGESAGLFDMPVMARKAGGNEVNAAELALMLKGVMREYVGAYFVAIVEQVSAMPGQGVSSMFRFGEASGIVKGVLGALCIPAVFVSASTWKRHLGLSGSAKDAARTMAVQRYPQAAEELKRIKDCGRADALLLAHWGSLSEPTGAEPWEMRKKPEKV
jgi:crossover junction endodeoxyribonuclease RuvC